MTFQLLSNEFYLEAVIIIATCAAAIIGLFLSNIDLLQQKFRWFRPSRNKTGADGPGDGLLQLFFQIRHIQEKMVAISKEFKFHSADFSPEIYQLNMENIFADFPDIHALSQTTARETLNLSLQSYADISDYIDGMTITRKCLKKMRHSAFDPEENHTITRMCQDSVYRGGSTLENLLKHIEKNPPPGYGEAPM